MWLTRLAVHRPITAVMILVSLLLLGGISMARLPLNFLPNEEFPFIGVFIPYPNGIPSQVEKEIARPVEEVLATLGGIKEIFSHSDPEQCFVGVEFEWGGDREVNVLRMEVKEKIDQIRPDLPADIQDIFLFTFDTNDIPIVEGRISAKDKDLSGSYDLIEHRIVNRLQRIPGVGRVNIHGVEPGAVSVYLKLDKIKEHNVDVSQLFSQLSSSNFNLTVGRVTRDGLRYDLRALSTVGSIEDIENLPANDAGLRLKDIADVVYDVPDLTYGRILNGEPAVAFWIQKASNANTVEVVNRLKAELDEINHDPQLEGIDVLLFFDQGEQIRNSLNGLLGSGFLGAVLAVGVLYFFLLRVGTTVIVALAIPISIIGTACFLFLTHRSLNILSMMGLMLAVGMLIDNAVVVLESIYRRMGMGDSAEQATVTGTRDVGRAVASATLTSIIVFAPVILGARSEITIWLKEVGLTISVTLVFSLLVSLTLIPVLTSHLLRGGRQSVAKNPVVERWGDRYRAILNWTAIRHPWITGIPIFLGVVVVTGVLAGVSKFKPDPFGERGMRHEYVEIEYDFSDNLNYRRTREYVKTVEDVLRPLRDKYAYTNMYSFYEDNGALTRLYFDKASLSEKDLKRLREDLRKDLPEMAGVEFKLEEDEDETGAFVVTLHGEDSDVLATMADEVKRRLALVPDVRDLSTDIEEGAEEVRVSVNGEQASRFDVSPQDVAQLMGITFRGIQLPDVRTEDREIDLWVSLQPEDRTSIEKLKALTVNMAGGREITLDQVATTTMARGASRIQRLNQRTSIRVQGGYDGEKLDDGLKEVRKTMDAMYYPPGYGWNFGSRIQSAQEQQTEILVNVLLAILCVYMVMACLFESLIHPAVVMICMPFASLGVIWLMVLTNTPFNLMAMIGIVILSGIVVNNGIVLVDHINHHRREGLGIEEAILIGGRERFRPILMTAATTILGLIPLALGGNHVGDLQTYPMARALIGGLASSTMLTLIMLPVYYHLAEKLRVLAGKAFPGLARLPGRMRNRFPRGRRVREAELEAS
jgi:HAE1 family hydrophobic/amphiphilic exporter-1